jgi:hypothetical protein
VSDKPENNDDDNEAQVFQPPNTMAGKVRKITGSVTDLITMTDKQLAGRKTDYAFAVDRDLERLTTLFNGPWADLATRDDANAEFRSLAIVIGERAASRNYTLMAQITELFISYLANVAAAAQQSMAIESYLNAIQVIWKQKLGGEGGAIGAQIIADLTTLNQKSANRR